MHPTDVDRHFALLQTQLSEDDLDEGSEISKTLRQLEKALRKDGFSLLPKENSPLSEPQRTTRTTVTKTITPDASSTEHIVRAFRVGGEVDAQVVCFLFDNVGGWKTRTFNIKGKTFVVVTNAPRWSKQRIKTALTARLNNGRTSVSPSVSVGV